MDTIIRILGEMEPGEAAAAVARTVREVLPLLDEKEQRDFIDQMLGGAGEDKVLGMVHL